MSRVKTQNKKSGKKFAAMALTALGTLFITACLALSAFGSLATDGETYYELQISEGVDAGVSQTEMRELDLLLADYLAGDASALDKTEAFGDREKAHMTDVYEIFDDMRKLRRVFFIFGCLFMAAAVMTYGLDAKCAWLGAAAGAALFFLPLAVWAIWAAADFSSAFTAMHHLLFDNDLWLLDPRTDLMIRMLPQRFFVAIAKRLAVGTGAAALSGPVICALFLTLTKRTREKRQHKL